MEINLKEYLVIIKKRLWLVVVIVFICTALTAVYSTNNYKPLYQASTKLIVNKIGEKDQMGKERIDYGAIGTNLALMNTYKEIIKTPAIMDKVVQRYPDINLSAEQLSYITTVSDLHETQLMTIIVQYYSHEQAVKIVNAVSDVFQAEIPKIMKVDNITILNRAKLQDDPLPINKKSNQYIILSFVASLLVSIGIIILLESLDDTLKTDQDIRQAMDLTTIAYIPKIKKKELKSPKKKKFRTHTGDENYAKTIH
ncbi:Capsular polysaccharide biosynthesis protein [Paenibacillus sp. 1_12]|uniref:YveK family protein n=1 Tax=Paenibacillus sp. 1_12 TaxID=1566278 RepID=UPI0008EC2434|nr:Wzz/FepE/Etk N-terminal domain-containing protein [Paenibacillus sp. 1_12]SFL10725.1 Capsular polysaccharide biosynthesis protein [Paenibacillus sp. 1_12]